MRVLVTGGAGFLGSHLCEALVAQGHTVVCMDNLITGRVENVAHLLGNEKFSFVKYNVCDYVHIEGGLDAILHFASPASPQDYLELPIATLKVGALGTHKVLGLAKAKGARILLASTSEVYGDPLVNPQPESYWGNVNPIGIRSCYDPELNGLDPSDKYEDPKNPGYYLPGMEPYHNPFDHYLVLQDRIFEPKTGQISFDTQGHNGYLGEVGLVNGVA